MNFTDITHLLKTGPCGLFLFLMLNFSEAHAQAEFSNQNDPRQIYDRMLESQKHISFRGLLTYEQGGRLSSFELESRIGNDTRREKLSMLNGPGRSHQFSFSESCDTSISGDSKRLSQHYNFYYRGQQRIAGRAGHAIVLSPIDKYRLGHRFVVDIDSGLMLRWESSLPDRRVLERTQYINLQILEVADEASDRPDQDNGQNFVVDANSDSQSPADIDNSTDRDSINESGYKRIACDNLSIANGWTSNWLPDGFMLVDSQKNNDRATLVYSDGLAAFSIFIDAQSSADNNKFLPPGTVQRGSTLAYINYLSNRDSSYLVTIVGEIPQSTAKQVLLSLKRE